MSEQELSGLRQFIFKNISHLEPTDENLDTLSRIAAISCFEIARQVDSIDSLSEYIRIGMIYVYSYKFDLKSYWTHLESLEKFDISRVKQIPKGLLPLLADLPSLYLFRKDRVIEHYDKKLIYDHLVSTIPSDKNLTSIGICALKCVEFCGFQWFNSNFNVNDFL